ncbi:MAG: MmgE/PrpD family protein [Dehalococcoidales bacterium]|nr:MAG: MmgE/PrpD family protein [Dehalococcoidales bacterium]
MENHDVDGLVVLENLSKRILNTRYEDIDSDIINNTKTRIFDIIGDALGAVPLPDIKALVDLVAGWGGKEEATILGYGNKIPVQDAAFVNCTMCRGFDRGPLAYTFQGRVVPHHVSETTVLTALTLGESKAVNGKELLTVMILGDDLAARIHLANDRPLPGEMRTVSDSKGPAQSPAPRMMTMLPSETFGAAAIAGRMLGLDLKKMKNTLCLVGRTEGFGGGIWDGSPTFKIGQGNFARSGIMAALLAKAGWNGAVDPFFGTTGFGQGTSTSDRYDHPELLVGDLGNTFYVETQFKQYLGGGPTQGPIEAALTLVNTHKFKREEIEEVILYTSPGVATGLHYARPYKVGDYPTGDALFSYKYAVASALARGTAGNKDYMPEAVKDPVVQELIGKVTLELAKLDKTEGIELEVKLNDGTSYSQYVPRIRMEHSNHSDRQKLLDKYYEQIEFSGLIDRGQAEKILDMVENLEKVENVADIVSLTVNK